MNESIETTKYYETLSNFFKNLLEITSKLTTTREEFDKKVEELRQAIKQRKVLFVFLEGDIRFIIKDKEISQDPQISWLLQEIVTVMRSLFVSNLDDLSAFAQYKLLVSFIYPSTTTDEELRDRYSKIKNLIEELDLFNKYIFYTQIPFEKIIDVDVKRISLKEKNLDGYTIVFYTVNQNNEIRKILLTASKEELEYLANFLMKTLSKG